MEWKGAHSQSSDKERGCVGDTGGGLDVERPGDAVAGISARIRKGMKIQNRWIHSILHMV